MKAYKGAKLPCEGKWHWHQHEFPSNPLDIIINSGKPGKNKKKGPHEDGAHMSCVTCK